MKPRSRLASATATAAAVIFAGSTAIATAMPASAATNGAHFVVVGATGSTSTLQHAVTENGGDVLAAYPKIGVVVAESTDADFAKKVRQEDGVQQAGATRNFAELQQPAKQATGSSGSSLAGDNVENTVARKSASSVAATATASGEEPLAANQWDMKLIGADKAHAKNLGDRNLVVGVVDSGVDATHPDLAPNIDAKDSVGCTNEGVADTSPAAWAPTAIDHGTHVAGTIAAAKNGIGIEGIAPNVKLASIKVVDDDGFIYPEYAICGFVWAAEHHVKVTNNSYYIDPWYLWCKDDPDQQAVVTAVQRAINFSAKKDVVNVAALGNNNNDLSKPVDDNTSPDNGTIVDRPNLGNQCEDLPAEVPGFVGVSSVGPKLAKSYFSNYGAGVTDVAAPGGDAHVAADTPDGNGQVLSTVWPGGGWGYKQGTSMASPHAAGVVALIRSAHPTWSARTVARAVEREAEPHACPGNPYDPTGDGAWKATCDGGKSGVGFYGAGVVNALTAVTK